MLHVAVLLGTQHVSELQAENDAAAVGRSNQRLVQARFERSGDVRAERLNQADHTTRTARAAPARFGPMQPQVSDVALDVGIAPGSEQGAGADLIHDLQIRLQERRRAELRVVHHRGVLESLGAERADAAPLEYVVECQRALA